jgi:adenylosuccinate synthase
MTVTIVGAQLGDEGKGGIVDLFGDAADVVARYQGGDNAGHTVVHEGDEYKLSLVPSGAIRGKVGILGNGCVVNLRTLFDEIDTLRDRGLDPDVFRERLEYVVPQKRALVEDVFGMEAGEEFDIDTIHEEFGEYGRRLHEENMTVNAGDFLAESIDDGENVVLEGAQGTSIDIDHGIYPYVTSSNPTAGGACTGTGLGPTTVGQGEIVGIVKAYLSRVGTGPLPTELEGDDEQEELAEYIREEGGEYGTVTGRPRRVGWLDVPMLRHAARASGFTGLAVNHLDVLAGLDEVKVGHAYELAGETVYTMPPTTEKWGECEPVLKSFDGWPELDWGEVADEGYDALPDNARAYLDYLSEELDTPIYAVGIGPDRSHSIVLERPFEQ